MSPITFCQPLFVCNTLTGVSSAIPAAANISLAFAISASFSGPVGAIPGRARPSSIGRAY